MFSSNKQEEPVFQFLAGTFHQDIASPDEALEELLEEESKEYLEHAVFFLTDFIQSVYPDIEKSEYIKECADGIYFPDLGLEPLQWLSDLIVRLKKTVEIS